VITLQDLFTFRVEGVTPDRHRRVVGSLVHTGLRPSFLDKFERRGVAVPTILQPGEHEAHVLAARRIS
jgi:hypothetical protein